MLTAYYFLFRHCVFSPKSHTMMAVSSIDMKVSQVVLANNLLFTHGVPRISLKPSLSHM